MQFPTLDQKWDVYHTYMYFRKSLNPYYERTLFDILFALV